MKVKQINSAVLQLVQNKYHAKGIYYQIGDIVFEAGIAKIFDIHPEDNLDSTDNIYKKALLLGFFTEAAKRELFQPKDIERWQLIGLKLIEGAAE